MSDSPPPAGDTPSAADTRREELRRRWLGHAAAAFDLMFDPQYQDQLRSFEQREGTAYDLSRDLACWLLTQHANADEQACPPAGQPACCPRCGKPAKPVTPEGPPAKRRLTTRSGEVELRRQKWRCTTCRVAFFPPGPQAGAGG